MARRSRVSARMRLSTLLLSSTLALHCTANMVLADGIIRVRNARPEEVRCTLVDEFRGSREINVRRTRVAFELPLHGRFLLVVEHAGCATKSILFDTHMSSTAAEEEHSFPFEVTLEGFATDSFAYAGPVGEVRYSASAEDFVYTTDYTKAETDRLYALFRGSPSSGSLYRPAVLAEASREDRLIPVSNASTLAGPPAHTLRDVAPVVPASVTLSPTGERGSFPTRMPTITSVVKRGRVHLSLAAKPAMRHERALDARTPPPSATPSALAESVPRSAPVECGTSSVERSPRMVIRIDRIEEEGHCVEWRKVTHLHGAVFYFRDGQSIPAWMYEQEHARR